MYSKNYQVVDIEQNTPEWKAFRKDKIGASHAPSIMGVGFQTPLQLWESLVFDKEIPVNPAMERGKILEPIARKHISEKLGMDFKPIVVQSKEHPWFIASLDGFYEKDGVPCILEIKCPKSRYVSGRVPEMYVPQVQHQMRIVGAAMVYFVNFYDENDMDVVESEYDSKYSDALFCEEKAFKARIDGFNPPEPCSRDWIEINDSRLVEIADKLVSTKAMIKQLESSEKELEDCLKKSLTNPRCRIGNLQASKVVRLGNIDYKKIELLQEMDLEPYRKNPVEYWVFK